MLARKLLIIGIVAMGAASAEAATINAASCSKAAVQAALNSAANGDTIAIPAGNCSSANAWSGYLAVQKQVTLQGAGIGNTLIGTSASSSGFHVLADKVRITGLTADCNHQNSGVHGIILVGDDTVNPGGVTRDFRIDNMAFVNCNDASWPSGGNTGWSAITVRGYSYGVIDHNTFEDCTGECVDVCADGVPNGNARSNAYGQYTNGTVYLEDNTWNYVHESENAIDGNSASRWVFRHNTIHVGPSARVAAVVSNHETCATCSCNAATTGDAGSQLMEVYANDLYNDRTNFGATLLVEQRGGRSLVYNNTIHSADTYTGHILELRNYRSFDYGNCYLAAHARGFSTWCHDADPGKTTEGRSFSKTALNGAIDANVTTLTLASTSGFPLTGGSVVIGSEQIDYTGVNGNTLLGCIRGGNGTAKAAHVNGASVDLLIFGQCLDQPNTTYVWGNKTVGNADKNGVNVFTDGGSGGHNDYSAYDIKSFAERPDNWQYQTGSVYSYTPYPYPHPLVSGAAPTGVTYSVKPDGSGDFTTIQACAAAAVAGDTCDVFAGTYSGWTQNRSGSTGTPITFQAHPGEAATLTGAITVTNRQYITIDGFRFTGHAITGSDGAGVTTSDIIIKNNTITWTSRNSTSASIDLYGDRNRIENNDISGSGSDAMDIGGQNVVVRGNYFHDVDGAASGEHIDFVQVIGGGTTPTLSFSLVENNVEKNCTNDGSNCHFIIVRTCSGASNCNLVADNVIVRYNYAGSLDGSGASYGGVGDNAPNGRFYNNTLATGDLYNGNGALVSFQNAPNGVVLNNISFNDTSPSGWSPMCMNGQCGLTGSERSSGNLAFTSGYTGAWNSPYSTETTYASLHNQNPLFTNFPANASLQAGSPARDAGVALTVVASADTGSGTSLIVNDARFFQPGWAGTQADWIAVGTTSNAVQISAINYTNNTLTLAAPLSRTAGLPVWLYKDSSGRQVLYGNASDVGAFEFNSGTPSGSACDLNGDSSTNVSDVQLCANQAIGVSACSTGDINQDSSCNVIDVQRVINNALGGQCVTQ